MHHFFSVLSVLDNNRITFAFGHHQAQNVVDYVVSENIYENSNYLSAVNLCAN